jgi:hypothetical protein
VSAHPQVSETGRGEPACRPGSVRPLARGGGHPSGTAVADSLVRSTREHRAGRPRSLAQGATGSPLDLAPGGVYRAAAVACGAGGLLHHRFTLTPADAGAVCFLWHCPAGHPGSALPTTLPCGARTFLTGLAPGATARPTHPCSGYADRRRPAVPASVLAQAADQHDDGEQGEHRQPSDTGSCCTVCIPVISCLTISVSAFTSLTEARAGAAGHAPRQQPVVRQTVQLDWAPAVDAALGHLTDSGARCR